MRLIDADALDAAFTALRFNADGSLKHWGDRPDWCMHGNEVETLLKDAPTVEQKTGWWRKRDSWMPGREQETKHFPIYECSECGWGYRIRLMSEFCYCPHCGAAMAEGESYETD